LRQRKGLELLKDYDLLILYHPGKALIADALSHKTHHSMSVMTVFMPEITRDLEKLGVELVLSSVMESYLSGLIVQPTLLDETKIAQVGDPEMKRIKVNISKGNVSGITMGGVVVVVV